MPKKSLNQNLISHQSALRLLQTEHRALEHWLHDDLGQNLVAIKSFAAAIMEQNKDSTDDTVELADIINQAAQAAYQATYNLMLELRAENAADQPIHIALTQCLQDARLKEKNIQHQFHIDAQIDNLDNFTKAVILRSVRSFINFSKLFVQTRSVSIGLHAQSDTAEHALELRLVHLGEFDIPHSDVPGLIALRQRIEAIGGEVHFESNNLDKLSLNLRFNPLSNDYQSA